MTQCDMILEHLEKYGSITPLEAQRRYGVMRLGARIWDLKQAGHDISVVMVQTKNRLGRTVRYAKYVLHEESTGDGSLCGAAENRPLYRENAPVAGTTEA